MEAVIVSGLLAIFSAGAVWATQSTALPHEVITRSNRGSVRRR